MKLIALLGSSGSGKSALAHEIALQEGCEIFSLDSLSIYKHIDIASAKPTILERSEVCYHALDVLEPNEPSNAMIFKSLLESAICNTQAKALLIVGGSSFFLKSIIDGLSPMPALNTHLEWVESLGGLSEQYAYLCDIDESYACVLKPTDKYRIQKALALFKATNTPPSKYFATHPKIPFKHPIEILCLEREREELRSRIAKRTKQMIELGIIEETESLLQHYGPSFPASRAIGTKECIEFLQGKIESKQILEEQIFFHTCQLAKRQNTFNRTQFEKIQHLDACKLKQEILRILNKD